MPELFFLALRRCHGGILCNFHAKSNIALFWARLGLSFKRCVFFFLLQICQLWASLHQRNGVGVELIFLGWRAREVNKQRAAWQKERKAQKKAFDITRLRLRDEGIMQCKMLLLLAKRKKKSAHVKEICVHAVHVSFIKFMAAVRSNLSELASVIDDISITWWDFVVSKLKCYRAADLDRIFLCIQHTISIGSFFLQFLFQTVIIVLCLQHSI